MSDFQIAGRKIGKGHPVFVIAEACDNHLGDMTVAKEMARLAKLAGADAVKYQHHLPDEEMLPDVPMSDNMKEPLYDFLKKYALTIQNHVDLKAYCDQIGIQYMCTPFSYKAAEELIAHNLLDAIKIGSGEMTDIPSLVKMSKFGKPMILSTGMSTYEEVDETYNAMVQTGIPLALTHCVSEYPPEYADSNLGVVAVMQQRYPKAIIGHSDHTPDLYTCYAAVALGAKIIEKHVIVDRLQPGPDQSVSIDFHMLADLVEGIRKIEVGLGSEKVVHHKEKQIREWAFRSVVSTVAIPKGTVITADMVWSKRPGTGIPSKKMHEVIGKTAVSDIPQNTLLSWDQLR